MKWLEKYADYAYALLRIVTGFIFLFHGAQKILGVLSQFQPPAWSQLWFGGIIELVGGLMVLLGFKPARQLSFAAERWPSLIFSITGSSKPELSSSRQ